MLIINKKIDREKRGRRGIILDKIKSGNNKTEIDVLFIIMEQKYIENGGQFTISKVNDIIPSTKNLEQDTIVIFKSVNLLEDQFEKVKKTMLDKKTSLIENINKEFLFNDYERRFNIKLEELLLALVGEESLNSEIAKQNKMKRVL